MSSEVSPGERTTVFAHLSGMLLADRDAAAAVQQLARAAHQTIPSATGAGVSLFDRYGNRVTTVATDTLVEAADALQYQLGQGPCLSAWATRKPQPVEDTTADPHYAQLQTGGPRTPQNTIHRLGSFCDT